MGHVLNEQSIITSLEGTLEDVIIRNMVQKYGIHSMYTQYPNLIQRFTFILNMDYLLLS